MPYKDPARHRQRERERYYANREQVLQSRRDRYASDKEWAARILRENREYHRANPDKRRKRTAAWREANRPRLRATIRANDARRRAGDPGYRFTRNIRTRILMALKKGYKSGSAVKLLGCSVPDAMRYLETMFRDGMTWKNYGRRGWHVDHVKPLSSFNLSAPDRLAAACHYTNLQPLWWHENLSKGATC